jgi:hypothetical protein
VFGEEIFVRINTYKFVRYFLNNLMLVGSWVAGTLEQWSQLSLEAWVISAFWGHG